MLSITCAALLLTATAATVSAQEVPGGYIVGGHDSSVEQHPSIVHLELKRNDTWRIWCGATIIADSYVLSAAHCLRPKSVKPENLRIRAGTSIAGKGGEIFYINSYLVHPNYEFETADSDIVLLALEKPLTWSNVVQPVDIIGSGKELPDNHPVQVAGWGTTIPGKPDSASAVLQEVTVFTVNHDQCKDLYRNNRRKMTENMVCAGILGVGGKDACQGDSGGPMYDNDVLVGIVSWGEGCADARYPGVFTKVSVFTDWIKSNIV